MPDKPTRKDQEQRVKEVEKPGSKHGQPEELLPGGKTLFRMIAEQSGEGISLADADGNYLFINPAFCKIFGYSEAELLTMNVRDLMPPTTSLGLFPKVLKKKSGRRVVELRKKNGSHLVVEVSGYPIQREDQLFVLGIVRDISSFEETGLAIKLSEERFRFLAENMGDVFWTVDMSLKSTYISPSVEKVLGYTPEKWKKQKFEKKVTPESLSRVRSILAKELKRDKMSDIDPDRSITMELEYYHHDGSTLWMESQVKAIRNQKGKMIGISGVSRDITNRKKTQDALIKEQKKLKQAISENRKLIRLLPICPACKKIRNEKGYWSQVESYIRDHSEAELCHSICPECVERMCSDFDRPED